MKLTKHTTTFYIIIGVLILILSPIALLSNVNHRLVSDSYCLKGEYPKLMDQYVQYIEGSIKAVIYQDSVISSWKAKQDLCSGHLEIYNQSWTILPYATFNPMGTFELLLTLITEQINEPLHADFFFLFMFLTVMIIGLMILKSYVKLKRNQPKERRGFTRLIRIKVLKKQNYKCDHCRKILTAVDFHHKNGDRSDNRERNCQALCPNCHAIETRGLLK